MQPAELLKQRRNVRAAREGSNTRRFPGADFLRHEPIFHTSAGAPLPLLRVSNLICAQASGDDISLDKLFYCPIDLFLMNTLPECFT